MLWEIWPASKLYKMALQIRVKCYAECCTLSLCILVPSLNEHDSHRVEQWGEPVLQLLARMIRVLRKIKGVFCFYKIHFLIMSRDI
jgi:hypothetical protein